MKRQLDVCSNLEFTAHYLCVLITASSRSSTTPLIMPNEKNKIQKAITHGTEHKKEEGCFSNLPEG